jgi:hypothetical protein
LIDKLRAKCSYYVLDDTVALRNRVAGPKPERRRAQAALVQTFESAGLGGPMKGFGVRQARAAFAAAIITASSAAGPAAAQAINARIDRALQNITTLVRAGRVGYATFWDGNKFVQCRRMPDRMLRCEAAGTSMQSSLKHVLTPERVSRLGALGWVLDPRFGNYVQTFAADISTARIADHILRTLIEAYDADASEVELQTEWVADVPCPPRAGPSQNLAGSVNDAPPMRATAVRACAYVPDPETPKTADSAEALFALYGTSTAAEIQRLRINSGRRVYVIFSAGIGYIQCMPQTSPSAFYCEAQSAESWPALAAVLTPERVSRLRSAGYADPGRAPNYAKFYPFDSFSDLAVAREILTILYEVYGYAGATALKISTESPYD